jgi:hypothetical protein
MEISGAGYMRGSKTGLTEERGSRQRDVRSNGLLHADEGHRSTVHRDAGPHVAP